MKHIIHISKSTPAKAESLLILTQKAALIGAFATGFNTLATAVNAWLGIIERD